MLSFKAPYKINRNKKKQEKTENNLNFTKENITLEELKLCPEFEGLSQEMAEKMLDYIHQFCNILASRCLEGIKASDQTSN